MQILEIKQSLIAVAIMGAAIAGLQACDQPPFGGAEGPAPNKKPSITIANVPLELDTVFAKVELHWDGGDPDGFVKHFQWRYVTVNPVTGDTLKSTKWSNTDKTSLSITFSSPEPINKQTFWVRSVDDEGAAGEAAKKEFYTRQTRPPEVSIATPTDGTSRLYINQVTDWYDGIQMTYEGTDADGEIVEYGWSVGGDEYHWTPDTSVTIAPDHFGGEGQYDIILKARDDTDLETVNPDTVSVTLVKPTFGKEVLIIDETDESHFDRGSEELASFNDREVDSLYREWFSSPDRIVEEWDYKKGGMPPRDTLGQYKMVLWHADNYYGNVSNAHKIGEHKQVLTEYMNVGGDFFMSGWKILKSLRPGAGYPMQFKQETFERDYLHIKKANESGVLPPGDMAGANGLDTYPDLTIDSTKVKGYPSPAYDYMVSINTMPERAAFTSAIYSYQCRRECSSFDFRGAVIGIRYFGTSFDAVVFGFPLFFMKKDQVEVAVDQIMNDLGY